MDTHRAVGILQQLIQFDTTNPPGNEQRCIQYLHQLLSEAGIPVELYAEDPARPNLVARLPGGDAPPLLLFGHVDVVTTENQQWALPPFEGRIHDGYVWGRGALDMKSGVAMMAAALLEVHAQVEPLAGDVIFCALADEEAGGKKGAQYLVNNQPGLFTGVRHAIGEFGGFPLSVGDQRMYLVQTAEKQPCWMEVSLRGPAGHGARPMRDGAMAELAHVLHCLNTRRLPIHICETTRQMIEAMAGALPWAKRQLLKRTLHPRWTDQMLRLMGELGRNLEPLFRNTVNATVVRGGEKANVIPSEIVLGLDGRLLPGQRPEDLIRELQTLVGRRLETHVLLHDPSDESADSALLPLLRDVLRDLEPGAEVAPYLLPGSSDARFFSKLGIQTYGFTPMNLPSDFNFFDTIHAADERIPIECLKFGTEAMLAVLRNYSSMDSV